MIPVLSSIAVAIRFLASSFFSLTDRKACINQDLWVKPWLILGRGKEECEKDSFIRFPWEPAYRGAFLLADACALARGDHGLTGGLVGPGKAGA